MFKKLFGAKEPQPAVQAPSASAAAKTINSIQSLTENEETLEKRKQVVEKKMEAELQKARDYNKQGKKQQALQCLKRKKLYEGELSNLDNMIMRVAEQRAMIEGQRTTAETLGAMHKATLVAKQNMKEMNIDKVDQVLDDINEVNEQMKQINDVFANPTGVGADLDEDELLGELEELEATELDAELLEPAPVPATKVPEGALPQAPQHKAKVKKTPEEEELEALEREMGMAA